MRKNFDLRMTRREFGVVSVGVTAGAVLGPAAVGAERPEIRRLGTIDLDMVETAPVVFRGKVYRFEYVRAGYKPNTTDDTYFRFIDRVTGDATPAFAHGFDLGSAMVVGDTVYVTGTDHWDGERVDIFASKDLEHWESWNALDLPGYGIFNTSMCKAEDKYVLMFEVGKPPEVAGSRFTARFATSKDLKHWTLTPPECTYAKDRYTAPHCLRYPPLAWSAEKWRALSEEGCGK